MKWFRKKEVWRPTWPTYLLLVLLAVSLLGLAVPRIYPFLAQQDPLPNASLLIVEGWMDDAALRLAVRWLPPGGVVVASGGPVLFAREMLGNETYAGLTAARLRRLGVPAESILAVPAPDTLQDRTYVSALAVRRRLEELGLFGRPANLVSSGAHARRSAEMFRRAFGEDYPLGVIAVEPPEYRLEEWYRHSFGVKHVLTELISWLYVRVVPPEEHE